MIHDNSCWSDAALNEVENSAITYICANANQGFVNKLWGKASAIACQQVNETKTLHRSRENISQAHRQRRRIPLHVSHPHVLVCDAFPKQSGGVELDLPVASKLLPTESTVVTKGG
jgi:hypothetical protein